MLGGRGGGLAERAFQVGVALAGLAGAGHRPGLDGARGQLGPGHQVRGGGEPGHVQADLGEDDLRGVLADAGDLVEPLDRRQQRGVGDGLSGPAPRCAVVHRCRRRRRERVSGIAASSCVDAGGEGGDLGVRASIWSSSIRASSAWWSSNRPVKRLDQGRRAWPSSCRGPGRRAGAGRARRRSAPRACPAPTACPASRPPPTA